ncbi:MAG: MarR family transcriptional regulator [Actinobacteria bacterium]|nr:MarR family transcriptional regulator [Actinomycetota bacterium]
MPVAPPVAHTDLAPRLRLAVMRLARRLRQQSVDEALTLSQVSALATLDRVGPLTLGDLAAAERVQPPTMTRVVASLLERGLVGRTPNPLDRRSAQVAVTADGRKLLDRNRSRRTAYLAKRLALLSPDERAALDEALPLLERLAGDVQ